MGLCSDLAEFVGYEEKSVSRSSGAVTAELAISARPAPSGAPQDRYRRQAWPGLLGIASFSGLSFLPALFSVAWLGDGVHLLNCSCQPWTGTQLPGSPP